MQSHGTAYITRADCKLCGARGPGRFHVVDKNVPSYLVRLTHGRPPAATCPDIILVHGGGPGVERIAAKWADTNGVHQVVCKPDWNAHGRAAPFRRNDELLNLLPKGVIAFPGSGITDKPGRQGRGARYPGAALRGVTRIASAGRVASAARPGFYLPPPRTPPTFAFASRVA